MKLHYTIPFVILTFCSIASANLPLGMSENQYNYNATTQVMTDCNGLQFKTETNGVITINDERYLAFAFRGTAGATTYTRTSMDFSWTWHLENNGGDYVFWAENDNQNFIWRQYYYFYESPWKPMKIKHYVHNNFTDLTDVQMFYLTSVTDSDHIERNGTKYNVGDIKPFHAQKNLTSEAPHINFNREFSFNIKDLIDDGFEVNEFYIGNGSVINKPAIDIMAIGFTKNNGVFPKGAEVWIDPTFATDQPEAPAVCPLDSNTIVVAWHDENNDDRTFAIYDTNGTLKVGPIDADDNAGASSGDDTVSVSAFNSTHFIIAWYDGIDFDISFRIYDSAGVAKTGIIDADTDVGLSNAVSVSAFNSTHFVIGWWDRTDNDTSFRIYDSSGVAKTSIIDADTEVSQTGYLSNGVSVSAFNSTHFVIGWYDNVYLIRDISFRIYDSSGVAKTGIIDVDEDAGTEAYSVSTSAFNSTHFVIGWFDDDSSDVSFRIYDSSGVAKTGITDADTNAGPDCDSVSIAAINSTHFVIGWFDDLDVDASFRLYDSSGTNYTDIIDANTTSSEYQDVASYEAATGIAICDDNFVMAHVYSASVGQWMAYDGSDGSSWNGICSTPSGEYTPPNPTTLANTTGNFWVNHTWSAGSGNVTNSYNVSQNGTWHNTTTTPHFNATSVGAHGYSDITVYAFNSSGTGTLSVGNITQNTTVPNNAVTITNTSDWSGAPGSNVYVDYDATDADSDTPTFYCNRTDLFADFSTSTGKGNWTATAGTYYVDFGVSDGYGSTSNYTMTITVTAGTPTPTNLDHTKGATWVNHTWSAGSGNVTDSYNVSINLTWHNTTTTQYFNNTPIPTGNWSNITVLAWNSTYSELSTGNVSEDVQTTSGVSCPHGDVCVNTTGWWRDGGAFNASAIPATGAIQEGVTAASSGETVYVYDGSYTDDVEISTASITVIGESMAGVSIYPATGHGFDITANNVNITKITVTGGTGAGKCGVHVNNADNCNISYNNMSDNYYGICAVTGSENTIIINNTASLNTYNGIHISSADNNHIANNTVSSNEHHGIYLYHANDTDVQDNIATYNDHFINGARGIRLTASHNNTIHNNNISYNYEGLYISDSINNTVTNNTVSHNYHAIYLYYADNNSISNGTAEYNTYNGVRFYGSDGNTVTDTKTASNSQPGVYARNSKNNIFERHNSTNNTLYGYYAEDYSTNNTLYNCDLLDTACNLNDTTSEWIIKYTDNRILSTDDPTASMTCYSGNCTLDLYASLDNYTINVSTLNVTVSTDTGSVTVSANSSLINIDYVNSSVNDLNITALDRQLILESAGVQTMVFDPTNIFNLWNFEYYVNATANRKAAAFNTYTTNATNLINFTFYDLYPSSNFDCKYNSSSFTTNTSSTIGTLEFNKSTWDLATIQAVEIYMTTTPYRCSGGVCTVTRGNAITLYLDLNDTTVTHVRAAITPPRGGKVNHSMASVLIGGATSWYVSYTNTGTTGTYTVNDFYSSKDGVTWKQLDSFLTFSSVSSGGGGGGGVIPDDDDEDDALPDGVDIAPPPEPEPEEHTITPAAQFSSSLVGGFTQFNDSYVISVETNQSGTVQIDEFILNPTTTSLIGGTRYGYVDIGVPNPNIGGTICFATPPDLTGTPGIYQLDNNEWMELETTQTGSAWCVDVAHFSYFAIADPDMESVIESLTQLSFSPPKVDGIMLWKWLSDVYVSTHVANRELANVSTSEGLTCEILTTGDYPNRTLECTYVPETGGDWYSMRYTGEVIAVDAEGYTRRIPVSLMIYDTGKLAFPLFVGVVLIGGVIMYRKYG